MGDSRETDPLDRVTRQDEARRQFEKAADAAREAHADPRPDHAADEPVEDEAARRERSAGP